jgi:hypothetical protein
LGFYARVGQGQVLRLPAAGDRFGGGGRNGELAARGLRGQQKYQAEQKQGQRRPAVSQPARDQGPALV